MRWSLHQGGLLDEVFTVYDPTKLPCSSETVSNNNNNYRDKILHVFSQNDICANPGVSYHHTGCLFT